MTATGEALIRLDGDSVSHVDRALGGEGAFTIPAVWRLPGFAIHGDNTKRRLRRLDQKVIAPRAVGMRQTAGDGINAGNLSIGFYGDPAPRHRLSLVMHEPTELTDQKYWGVRSRVRSRHM